MSMNKAILELLNATEDEVVKQLDKDVREIFSTMVGAEISEVSTRVDAATTFSDSVTAMVGLAGVFNGMINLHVSKRLAIHFASSMLGMTIEDIDDDVIDALGEIANMLGGSFKHHFVLEGHEVKLSIPSVITGDQYEISAGSLPDILTLSFTSEDEPFMISVYLENGQ
jgi:chemotaxis protein CheX